MRTEYHLVKAARFERTMSKLDYDDDYETLIEDYLLASAHLINAILHTKKILKEDKDIKHNQLFEFLKKDAVSLEFHDILSDLIQQLEQLRPSYVYGKGENGNTARKAESVFKEIKDICDRILSKNR